MGAVVHLWTPTVAELVAKLSAAVRSVERGLYNEVRHHMRAAIVIARRPVLPFEARELAITVLERLRDVLRRAAPATASDVRELEALCSRLRPFE